MSLKPLLFVVLLITSACAFDGESSNDAPIKVDPFEQAVDKIAMNLIFALSQVPGSTPVKTTVQLSEPTSVFGLMIESRLRDAGYGIQITEDNVGVNNVNYSITNSVLDTGERTSYSLSIGKHTAVRYYDLIGGTVVPRSPMNIIGASIDNIVLNDNIFAQVDESLYFTDIVSQTESKTVEIIVPAVSKSLGDKDNPIELIFGGTDEGDDKDAGNRFGSLIKQNMYDTKLSNYAELFKEYTDIERHTLVFDNDSTVLNRKNKDVIASVISRMDKESDVLSVIGCSHGITHTPKSNQTLAIGRAGVVKTEIVANGVNYGQVLDEGCWDYRISDTKLPNRGVVLTLKRLKG